MTTEELADANRILNEARRALTFNSEGQMWWPSEVDPFTDGLAYKKIQYDSKLNDNLKTALSLMDEAATILRAELQRMRDDH